MSNGENPASGPVQLRSIIVKTGRLICDVAIPEKRFRYTTPEVAALACASCPDLPHHACVNDVGPSFGEVVAHTSTAHLLEHMAISIQTQASADPSARFVGTTEWVDEEQGIARITLSFHDDLEALRAFNEATRILNIAVLTCLA